MPAAWISSKSNSTQRCTTAPCVRLRENIAMGPSGYWIKCVCATAFLLTCISVATSNAVRGPRTTFNASSMEQQTSFTIDPTPGFVDITEIIPIPSEAPSRNSRFRPASTKTLKGTCPIPPELPNAVVVSGWSEDNYRPGHMVTYTCRSGFVDTEARNFSIVCYAESKFPTDPRWSSPYFLCQITCEHPDNPANGFAEVKSYTFGSTVTFKCRGGYILSGAQHSTCQDNGEWDKLVPECQEVLCEDPPLLEHGEAVLADDDSKTAIYKCHTDFILDGNSTLECLDDGTWTTTQPFCRPKLQCRHPPPIDNASLQQSAQRAYELGTLLRYRCNPGYTVSRDSSYSIACVNSNDLAKWTPQKLSCLPKQCSFPGEIENGYFNGTNFMYRGKVTYHCNTGYFSEEKETTAECMADGSWSRSLPSCEPVQCPDPFDVPNGIISSPSSLTFDSVIRYRCKGEMQLMGPSVRVCQEDGTWSGQEPMCMAVLCSPFHDVKNGKWVGNKHTSDVVTFSCNQGFLLAGERQITCLPNRQWSAYPPTCQPVCPPLPVDKYAIIPEIVRQKRYFTVGEKVVHLCGGGNSNWDYTLVCANDHRWHQVEKSLFSREWKCLEFCYRPQPQQNAVLSKAYQNIDFYAIGKYVYFDCLHGYTSQARGFYMKCVVGRDLDSYWTFYSNKRCNTGGRF